MFHLINSVSKSLSRGCNTLTGDTEGGFLCHSRTWFGYSALREGRWYVHLLYSNIRSSSEVGGRTEDVDGATCTRDRVDRTWDRAEVPRLVGPGCGRKYITYNDTVNGQSDSGETATSVRLQAIRLARNTVQRGASIDVMLEGMSLMDETP